MSGYNYDNRRKKRRGDSGSQRGRGDQDSSYWHSSHYKSYEKYNQYQFPELVFPQQWNHVSWDNQNQYSGTYGREPGPQNQCPPRHTFSSSQGHSRSSGRASSRKGKSSRSHSRKRRNQERHSSSSSSRNRSSSQRKVTSPPLGSEEARKKTLAKARDKIKSCLLSFKNEKSEVLENLLSNEEQKIKESARASTVRLEKSGYAELQLTTSDLKVIGMVNTSGAGTSSELDVTGNYPVETISTNELLDLSIRAEIAAQSSDCSEKVLVSNDGCNTFSAPDIKLLGHVERDSICSNLERETGLRDSSKQTEQAPHSIYKCSRLTSESSNPRQLACSEVQASGPHPCAQFRSTSSNTSNPADNSNQSKDVTNMRSSCEHPSSSSQGEPKRTLKNLKQRIIQQFLKMGKNNLKDLINNPRSRKFEFAMNHLMKEHRMLLSRELRALAQSRIRGQDVENQEQIEQICETNSLLDTDIAINLSHLPQEVIEQLGNLLQLNLLDNAESIDFQPITVEDESSVHDLQNIQALQVALLSEENIKREVIESETKPVVGTEVTGNAVEENVTEKDLMEGQHGPTSDFQQNRSTVDAGTGQIEDTLRRTMEDEQEVVFEEGGTVKKPRNESNKWPSYIPLGKGFMNRSGEFGNLFYEFSDFSGMRSTESEAVDGQNDNVMDVSCTKQTDGEVAKHHQVETYQKSARTLDKMSSHSASEANEAHTRPTDKMADCNSSLETNVMPNEVWNTEVGENSGKSLSNASTEKSVLERLATDCLTNTDIGVKSCGEDNWIDASHEEGFDSCHHTSDDTASNFPASDLSTVIQAKDMLKGSADVGEPSEYTVVTDRHIKGSADCGGPLTYNGEPLEGSTVADKPMEVSSERTSALFEDSDVNNVKTLLRRINEEMNIPIDDTGSRETEIKDGDFEELNSDTIELPTEGHVTKEDSCVIENLVESSERMDSNYGIEGKRVENLQTNLNTDGSDENSYSQLDTNVGNSYNVKDTPINIETNQKFITSENQNDAAVSDPQSEPMDTSFVLTGNDTENINVDEDVATNGSSSQSASTEHSVNSNDTAEAYKSGVSNEIDISPSKEMQAKNISVDDLYGDLNYLPVAKDITNSTVSKTQVDNSADNYMVDVSAKPVSEETEEMDGNGLSIVKSAIPDEDGSRGNDSLTAEAGVRFELSSNGTAGSREPHDKIMEIYRCNVVVKTEKFDNTAEDRTSVLEEQIQHEVNIDAPRVVPEPQHVGSLAQPQPSFLCNPVQEVTVIEVSTQTQPPEELDFDDVQRMLQLLEKSSQLSPELAKLLKDHFSLRKVTKENESSKLSRSVNTEKDCAVSAPKGEAQCLIHPLNSAVSPSPHFPVSEIHDMDSTVETTRLPHTSEPSYSMDGMEPSFRGPSLLHSKGKMSSTKQINLTKQDDTSTELHRVQKARVDSKESECSAGVSSFDVTGTSSPCAAIDRCAGSDGGLNTRRDVQGTAVDSNSKFVFLKMLEIDKEIQKLMEVKLELYRKLHLSLETDSACTNRNSSHSPKSRGLQYTSPTTASSSQTLCNRVVLSNNHNTQQMHMGFVTVNNNEPTGNLFTSDRPTSASTPMVMLPIDYVLGSSAELQNTHLSLPRHKLNECLKTFDTSVVEAVLNSFNLPDCQSREDAAVVIRSSDHENQNKTLGDVNEATPLKSKSDQLVGNSANKGRRYLAPHFSSLKESRQSETNSSPPEAMSLKKQVSKSKLNVSKERRCGKKKKQSRVQRKTGIAVNNKSSQPVGNREKRWIGTSSDATAGKPVQSNSLMQTAGKELQNRRQTEIGENKDQKENLSRSRSTRQKAENINNEKESSQSDSSAMVEDRKETRSSVKTKVPAQDNKQSETDSSPSSNRSRRYSQRMFPEAGNSLCGSRRNTRAGSLSDAEFQLKAAAETVKSRKRRTQSSKGRNSTSFDESESSDCVSKVTCKRKVTVRTEVVDTSSQEELTKPATESRSRRSCTRIASDFQDMQTTVMDGNATEMGRKVKTVKIEQTDDVDGSTLSARQLKRTRNINNHNVLSSSEVLNSGLSSEQYPSSRSRPHVGGTQKRKPDELEGPPSKVQHLGPKVDLLQWNLQDCFVMVKPLAIEAVAHSSPFEDIATTNGLGSQRIESFSSSSDELSVAEFVGKNKKETDREEQDVKHKFGKSDDSYRVDLTESAAEKHSQVVGSSSEQDPFGGVTDAPSCQPQPPELHIEPYGNIPSSPLQLPPDLLMQTDLPGQLQGHCILPEIVAQDENSISTLVSDTLSVTSDGEQSIAKRSGNDERSDLQHIADGKDDCDRDSAYSYDTPQEGREGMSSTASKHKTSKKHKKDRKSDGIERLVFESHEGPILDIKTVGRHMLAASEDGNVYCYSLKSGKFKRKYEGHNAAVTCLCVIECSNNSDLEAANGEQMAPDVFFTGSLDKHLQNFRFKTGELVHNPVNVGNPIQCMDHNWGVVYIGTQAGEVVRFNIKTSSLIGEPMKIGRESVLALKATKEGARRVLIIGSRNKPIAVRDAATGLLLRTVCNNWSHTVYSLVLSTSLVYCGTKTGIIPAVEFTTGDEVCRFKAAAGVVCMRIYNNLLFAGCYDGNIYVFSIHDKTQVSSIPGPGKMLLCMDIVKNRIIAGSKDNNKLEAWGFPQELRSHLKETKHR